MINLETMSFKSILIWEMRNRRRLFINIPRGSFCSSAYIVMDAGLFKRSWIMHQIKRRFS